MPAGTWQGSRLADGRLVDEVLVARTLDQELDGLRTHLGDARFEEGRLPLAADLFRRLVLADELADFLTLAAYDEC